MPVGEIESRAAKFQRLLFAEMEALADRQVFVQLHGLAKLRDGRREIAINQIRRLNECVLIDVRARRIFRIPARIQQRLAEDEAAARITCAEQILSATD